MMSNDILQKAIDQTATHMEGLGATDDKVKAILQKYLVALINEQARRATERPA